VPLPTLSPNRLSSLLWLPLVLAGLGLAAAAGWQLGRSSENQAVLNPEQQRLQRRSNALEAKLIDGTASDQEQLQLLKLRLASGDTDGAVALLEPLSDRNPNQWSLRLLLADLRQQQNDATGAEREIRQVLNINPIQPQALQDYARLQLKLGNEAAVIEQLQAAAIASQGRPESLPIGLLQADLQQRQGLMAEAEATYSALIAAHPTDPRPLLALALLEQGRGQIGAATALVQRAKLYSTPVAGSVLDQVAASWSVWAVRQQAPSGDAAELSTPEPTEAEASGVDRNELAGRG
jgi:tetratricopeptide (TPR) repeat protein